LPVYGVAPQLQYWGVTMKTFVQKLALACALIICATSPAKLVNLSHDQMLEVIKIARAINLVNPYLEDSKYVEYAMGIHQASLKYSIEPTILIAIAQQETNFRDNLPEGKAGEIGICQIRKMWLKNPKFISEFKHQTIKDLSRSSKNFLFAAWILKDLRINNTKGSLPFWSYYNAVRFENRFKYFLAVNKNIATLKRHDAFGENRIVASDENSDDSTTARRWSRAKSERRNDTKKSDTVGFVMPMINEGNRPVAPAPAAAKVVYVAPKAPPARVAENGRWLPDAFKQVQKEQIAREAIAQGVSNRRESSIAKNSRKSLPPSILRAAVELNVTDLIDKDIVQD